MRVPHVKLFIGILSLSLLSAQQTPPSVPMFAPPPPAVSATANVIGAQSSVAYTYYVIVNYPAGSVISQPVVVRNAPGTLTTLNYVLIGWGGLAGATSYDVIRLTGIATAFNGVCTSCTVVTGLIGTTGSITVNDNGSAPLANYTATNPAVAASASFYLNTRDYNPPQIRQVVDNTDAPVFWGMPIGNYVPPSTVTGTLTGFINGIGENDLVCNAVGSGNRIQVETAFTPIGTSGTTTFTTQFKATTGVYYVDSAKTLTAGGVNTQVESTPLILDPGECDSVNVNSFGTQVAWFANTLTYPISNAGPVETKVLGINGTTPIVVFTSTGSGTYVFPTALTFTQGVSNLTSIPITSDTSATTTVSLFLVPGGGTPGANNIIGQNTDTTPNDTRALSVVPIFVPPRFSLQIAYSAPATSTTAWARVAYVRLP
jgi:hypothetical protein